MWKIGQAQPRIEDPKLVRGEGSFADDRRQAGQLEMVILRSSVAAGKLTGLDIDEARAMPGVVDILTGADQEPDGIGAIQPRAKQPGPDGGEMRVPVCPPLATDAVKFVGHPIAVVLAETLAEAIDAAEAIFPEIEDEPSVTDAAAAMEPDAPRVWAEFPDNHCFRAVRGDPDATAEAIAAAPHVTRARLRITRVTAAAMEPRSVVATYDEEAGYYVDLGTQAPHNIRSDLAKTLGVEPPRIRVNSNDTGGSFGMKNAGYPEYAIAAWAAKRTGRPVHWLATRNESFLGDAHARDMWVDAAIGLDEKGRIQALQVHMLAGIGACLGPATAMPPVNNLGGLSGVYVIPKLSAIVDGVFINAQATSAYRGAGRPEATYVIERLLDLAARETGRDRAELRRLNMIQPDQMPYKTGFIFTYDCGDFPAVMDAALKAADWDGFPARREASEKAGKLRGLGIANPIEVAAGPPNALRGEYVSLRLTPQGSAKLITGSSDSGMGHATAFRQVLGEYIGIDPEAIDLEAGNTEAAPRGTGSFGSRTITTVGTGIYKAVNQAVDALRPAAAAYFGEGTDPASLTFDDASFHAPDGRSVTFLEVLATTDEALTFVTEDPPDGATFPNGCHVCEVEVDPDTGRTEVLSYVVADDVGTVVNPMMVYGQIRGGVAQGLGQAMMESIVFDEDSGQLLTAGFTEYAMPRSVDLPMMKVVSYPVPTATNPLGVKGAGEAGTVGALACCISAVADALAARGVTQIDMPLTPQTIWRALQSAG